MELYNILHNIYVRIQVQFVIFKGIHSPKHVIHFIFKYLSLSFETSQSDLVHVVI